MELESRINRLEIESGVISASLSKDVARLEKLMEIRFEAEGKAVYMALEAQRELNGVISKASDKAIDKAETAQRDYNQRSNEFRGQLDDQAKTLMPRTESAAMFKAFEEKLQAHQSANEKTIDAILQSIASLREARSGSEGRTKGIDSGLGWVIGGIGILAAVLSWFFRK
jgi:molecular chaperone GrpE (heat shock protein)